MGIETGRGYFRYWAEDGKQQDESGTAKKKKLLKGTKSTVWGGFGIEHTALHIITVKRG